jgi:diadenosine tetraphosphatase ApaH/serine/threonine PP2A family protein phosphatase
MNMMYGFTGEVKAKYDTTTMNLFTEVFHALPLALCVDRRALVLHGGLFQQDGVTLEDIARIDRFREPPESGLMSDLLWSDPQPFPGRGPSKRGMGQSFGPDITARFLAANGLDVLIRSHEVKDDGYVVEHGGKCITVFSAVSRVWGGVGEGASCPLARARSHSCRAPLPIPTPLSSSSPFSTPTAAQLLRPDGQQGRRGSHPSGPLGGALLPLLRRGAAPAHQAHGLRERDELHVRAVNDGGSGRGVAVSQSPSLGVGAGGREGKAARRPFCTFLPFCPRSATLPRSNANGPRPSPPRTGPREWPSAVHRAASSARIKRARPGPPPPMNLFLLARSPGVAASLHGDRHAGKLLIEVCQMLYTAHHLNREDEGPAPATPPRPPSSSDSSLLLSSSSSSTAPRPTPGGGRRKTKAAAAAAASQAYMVVDADAPDDEMEGTLGKDDSGGVPAVGVSTLSGGARGPTSDVGGRAAFRSAMAGWRQPPAGFEEEGADLLPPPPPSSSASAPRFPQPATTVALDDVFARVVREEGQSQREAEEDARAGIVAVPLPLSSPAEGAAAAGAGGSAASPSSTSSSFAPADPARLFPPASPARALLSTTWDELASASAEAPRRAYRPTHAQHPVSRWVRTCAANYDAAAAQAVALAAEVARRTGKEHGSTVHALWLATHRPPFPDRWSGATAAGGAAFPPSSSSSSPVGSGDPFPLRRTPSPPLPASSTSSPAASSSSSAPTAPSAPLFLSGKGVPDLDAVRSVLPEAEWTAALRANPAELVRAASRRAADRGWADPPPFLTTGASAYASEGLPAPACTPFPLAMPPRYWTPHAVASYRAYYVDAKASVCGAFTRRPRWFPAAPPPLATTAAAATVMAAEAAEAAAPHSSAHGLDAGAAAAAAAAASVTGRAVRAARRDAAAAATMAAEASAAEAEGGYETGEEEETGEAEGGGGTGATGRGKRKRRQGAGAAEDSSSSSSSSSSDVPANDSGYFSSASSKFLSPPRKQRKQGGGEAAGAAAASSTSSSSSSSSPSASNRRRATAAAAVASPSSLAPTPSPASFAELASASPRQQATAQVMEVLARAGDGQGLGREEGGLASASASSSASASASPCPASTTRGGASRRLVQQAYQHSAEVAQALAEAAAAGEASVDAGDIGDDERDEEEEEGEGADADPISR